MQSAIVSEVVLWQCWQTVLLTWGWEFCRTWNVFLVVVLFPVSICWMTWLPCSFLFFVIFTLPTEEGAPVSHCLLSYSRQPPNTCFVRVNAIGYTLSASESGWCWLSLQCRCACLRRDLKWGKSDSDSTGSQSMRRTHQRRWVESPGTKSASQGNRQKGAQAWWQAGTCFTATHMHHRVC